MSLELKLETLVAADTVNQHYDKRNERHQDNDGIPAVLWSHMDVCRRWWCRLMHFDAYLVIRLLCFNFLIASPS